MLDSAFRIGIMRALSRMRPSSRGLGHCPFTAATGVRIPVGVPTFRTMNPSGIMNNPFWVVVNNYIGRIDIDFLDKALQ